MAVYKATSGALNFSDTSVELHNFNARVQILKEGEFDQKWIPALTFGVHYKYNDTSTTSNEQEPAQWDIESHRRQSKRGGGFTLYASKLFTQLPRPVLVELGGRATEGVWDGLRGFTDRYNFVFEGNVGGVRDRFHSRWRRNTASNPRDYNYNAAPSLIGKAGDWWTIDAAYVVNKHLTLAVGYGHFGNVLNHRGQRRLGNHDQMGVLIRANSCWGPDGGLRFRCASSSERAGSRSTSRPPASSNYPS